MDENFNPHSRVGSDGIDYDNVSVSVGISIHTPAWGATQLDRSEAEDVVFQSTLPRGEQQFKKIEQSIDIAISIHTPAWGATTTAFYVI